MKAEWVSECKGIFFVVTIIHQVNSEMALKTEFHKLIKKVSQLRRAKYTLFIVVLHSN